MTTRKLQHYPPEFKAEAVKMATEVGASEASRRFDSPDVSSYCSGRYSSCIYGDRPNG
jgi:transposase-like protein